MRRVRSRSFNAASGARVAATIVASMSPAKPCTNDGPELRNPGDQSVRAERVALGDQSFLAAVRDPVRREEMLRHVGVERGAQDPEAHLDQERQRAQDDRADRGGHSVADRAR